MKEFISTIDKLKGEFDLLKPLKKEYDDLLWQKFRLEWNYNSNHIEGNTLTYGDTELLLKLGDEFKAQNNSLKDVNEMRAHDTAIFIVRDWAINTQRDLVEKDIRELNEIILVKDFWSDAQTSGGQHTRRLIRVGEYKEYPNHVKLKSGEIFKYAEPNEVAARMSELLSWYNSNKGEHPLVVAAFLHYKFVIIHPFDDGNGRVSRLLMNYHLMKEGYPPIIIKSEDKPNYLYALNQADSGNETAFIEYLAAQLIWSLETSIKAGKGKLISEKEDLYKEIEVWKKQLKSGLPTNPKRDDRISMILFDKSISKLFDQIEQRASTFKDLFLKHAFTRGYKLQGSGNLYKFPPNNIDDYRDKGSDKLKQFELELVLSDPLSQPDSKNIRVSSSVYIELNIFDYEISLIGEKTLYKKSYKEFLNDKEIESITEKVMQNLFKSVKSVS